jgi:hypothetical protein
MLYRQALSFVATNLELAAQFPAHVFQQIGAVCTS